MVRLENEIVKKTIIGVLSIVGLGFCSTGVWAVKTLIRHEQKFQGIQGDLRSVRYAVYAIGRKVGVKDYELLPLLDRDR